MSSKASHARVAARCGLQRTTCACFRAHRSARIRPFALACALSHACTQAGEQLFKLAVHAGKSVYAHTHGQALTNVHKRSTAHLRMLAQTRTQTDRRQHPCRHKHLCTRLQVCGIQQTRTHL
eukprot:1615119-Pleurochrysis_carterae.AAC.1